VTAEEFAQLEQISRRSLRMYDLTDREKRVSEVIIDFSFKRGRENAVIPRLQLFVNLTGLDKGDISRALQRLEDRGIVQISGPKEARVYAFIPSARFWMERKPLYDVELAIETERELARINAMPAGYEPTTGQGTMLPADEPGLDEGMAAAARDDTLAMRDDGESPIGESPTMPGVGDLPTSLGHTKIAHARNVKRNNVDNVNVAVGESPTGKESIRFADPERDFVFQSLTQFADSEDFRKYRPKWITRVREHPGIVREALGDARMYAANPKNKIGSRAALVFRRAQQIAKGLGKTFHLW
jgi:hypothetical protein